MIGPSELRIKESMMQEEAKLKVIQELEKTAKYFTIHQFSINNPFTESSLRNMIFKADERQSTNGVIAGNGLKECGAIVRVGRKVLINETKFYAWIEAQNGVVA